MPLIGRSRRRVCSPAVIAFVICACLAVGTFAGCKSTDGPQGLPSSILGAAITYHEESIATAAMADPSSWQGGVAARVDIDAQSIFYATGTTEDGRYTSVVVWAAGQPGIQLVSALLSAYGRSPDLVNQSIAGKNVVVQTEVEGNLLYYLVYERFVLVFDVADDSVAEQVIEQLP